MINDDKGLKTDVIPPPPPSPNLSILPTFLNSKVLFLRRIQRGVFERVSKTSLHRRPAPLLTFCRMPKNAEWAMSKIRLGTNALGVEVF